MSKSETIREVLRKHPEGLTVDQISCMVGFKASGFVGSMLSQGMLSRNHAGLGATYKLIVDYKAENRVSCMSNVLRTILYYSDKPLSYEELANISGIPRNQVSATFCQERSRGYARQTLDGWELTKLGRLKAEKVGLAPVINKESDGRIVKVGKVINTRDEREERIAEAAAKGMKKPLSKEEKSIKELNEPKEKSKTVISKSKDSEEVLITHDKIFTLDNVALESVKIKYRTILQLAKWQTQDFKIVLMRIAEDYKKLLGEHNLKKIHEDLGIPL